MILVGQAGKRLGLADTLPKVIADPRSPLLVTHPLPSILRARILAIAGGCEDRLRRSIRAPPRERGG